MNGKKYVIVTGILLIVAGIPVASAHESTAPNQNHLFLATIQITGYNGTIFPLAHFFINHSGVCAYMRIWTGEDGHVELSKIGNPSSNIVLDGNQTITIIGFIGFAVAGGNCSQGYCNPMNVHGKALVTTW
jgi:hypothetical protein